MLRKHSFSLLLLIVLIIGLAVGATAGDKVTVNTGVDFYNRYIWRGLDIASTPSLQPSFSIGYSGWEFGIWGAYTMANETSASDEIDFWLGYTIEMEDGMSIGLVATDYYFPNAGIDFFNFNNHDDVIIAGNDTIPDPGAHLFELGGSFTGPSTFPITISGYINIYNEAGSNTYFQVDYPVNVGDTELGLFCGATGGSKDNPDYYGSEDFAIINVGVTASREIKVSEQLSVPLSISFILNPNQEISYLLAGFSF